LIKGENTYIGRYQDTRIALEKKSKEFKNAGNIK